MQWRIINDRRLWLGVACDKLATKEYARRTANKMNLNLKIPETYWVGTDVRELMGMIEKLPARWVLKPNHSSGRFRILDSDHEAIDWDDLVRAGDKWIQRDEEELVMGHYGYGLARHLIFAEERVGVGHNPPATARVTVVGNRVAEYSYNFGTSHLGDVSPRKRFRYDTNFNRMDLVSDYDAAPNEHSRIDELTVEGRSSLRAITLALCGEFDFSRIDLFVEEEIWLNELTAYSGGGIKRFHSHQTQPWGDAWLLPDLERDDPRQTLWQELLSIKTVGTLQR